MKRMIFLSLLLLLTSPILSQSVDAQKLLENVKNKFSIIKDYTADIEVDVNVEFLKTPKVIGKIFFKQPDKMKIKSEGFALLPKEGFNISPASLLKGNYTSIFEKEEQIDGMMLTRLKVIPLGDSQNIILSTVWVDQENSVIRMIESTTKNSGTFKIEFRYDNATLLKYPLPDQMDFSFDVSKMEIPRGFSGDNNEKSKKGKKNKLSKGSVRVTYSNYKVNGGVDDVIFKEDKKKK